MKQHYLDYADYTIWANNRIIQNLITHDIDIMSNELVGSFPTIRATIIHMWYAEMGWLSRLSGSGWNTAHVDAWNGSNLELLEEWKISTSTFRDFVVQADLDCKVMFDHKGEHFSIPTREIIQTVLNHSTYHRGQVVLYMRQLGITSISQTDYIEWVREKHRGN